MGEKVILVTDEHRGARSENLTLLKQINDFYAKFFLPLIDKVKPIAILNGGDIFDRRKYINMNVLHNSKKFHFEPLNNLNIPVHCILGNHDTYFKDENNVNSSSLILNEYKNFTVYEEPREIIIADRKILMFPWVPTGKYLSASNILQNSKADIVLAHADIVGFDHGLGVICHEGFDSGAFKNFPMVLSGHFHKKQSNGNIHYLGTPYELTWADYNQPKGVHILDLETLELDFIRYPVKLHYQLNYSDEADFGDLSILNGKYVKIVVKKSLANLKLDSFIDRLIDLGTIDVKIKEYIGDNTVEDISNSTFDTQSTISIIENYINSSNETDVSNGQLLDYIKNLYSEAIHMDSDDNV